RQREILQALVGEFGAPPIQREHQPRRRIEVCRLYVSREAQSAIDSWIPLWEASVPDRLERVVGEREMISLQIERDVDPAEQRRVFDEECDCEQERYDCANHPFKYLLKKSTVRCQASLAAAW